MLVSGDSQGSSGLYARGAHSLLGSGGHDLETTFWEKQHQAEPLRKSNLDKRNSNCKATLIQGSMPQSVKCKACVYMPTKPKWGWCEYKGTWRKIVLHPYCQVTVMSPVDRDTRLAIEDANLSSATGLVGDLGHAPAALWT